MAHSDQVDPEVLRKARHLVEVYDLKPRLSAIFIATKVFPVNYSSDGFLYLDSDLYDHIHSHLQYFENVFTEIVGIEFSFTTVPNMFFNHSILLSSGEWHLLSSFSPPHVESFASISMPVQTNDIHSPLRYTRFRSIQCKSGSEKNYIIPITRSFQYPPYSDSDDSFISIPLLASNMIFQRFQGIHKARIIVNYPVLNF